VIETYREIVVNSAPAFLAWGGLIIGIVFGFIVYRTNFCSMGSISDMMNFGDSRRFRSWMLAIAVAVVGVGLLQYGGIIDASTSMYLNPNFGWLGNIVGGLLFGYGMVFAGGCMSKNLVRAGGGDLRSVVVLIVAGIVAFMTIGGILGPVRVALFGPSTKDLTELGLGTQSAGDMLAHLTGMGQQSATWLFLSLFVAALLIYVFKDAGFRRSPTHLIAGIGIGLAVVAGWALTGFAYSDFADVPQNPVSLTFVRPSGDTLDYLMRFTALGMPRFGVVTTLGTLLGGFLAALSTRSFKLNTFADASDTVRAIFGAILMGIGGVVALGCTVGQGLSGISTLAMGSFIAVVFIILGGMAGIKTMEVLA